MTLRDLLLDAYEWSRARGNSRLWAIVFALVAAPLAYADEWRPR